MFEIELSESVEEDMKALPAHVRGILMDAMESNLLHEPVARTRNRKPLRNRLSPWRTEAVLWELRVDRYRVFYDVDETGRRVFVRLVREKLPSQRTEDIL